MPRLKNRSGQSHAVEYVITFFLVVAVITAMTVYIRRLFQARILDAVHYMADTVDADYNGSFRYTYEPYYVHANSERVIDLYEEARQAGSLPLSSGIARKDVQSLSTGSAFQNQLPPHFAD